MTAQLLRLGHYGPNLNDPPKEVTAVLENLLERARAGELKAVAVAVVDAGDFVSLNWALGTAMTQQLAASIARLEWQFHKAWNES